jgi:hypothetical protein
MSVTTAELSEGLEASIASLISPTPAVERIVRALGGLVEHTRRLDLSDTYISGYADAAQDAFTTALSAAKGDI